MSNHSIRRITQLSEIINAKSYLEIGVAQGYTFMALDFHEMHAVDPKFAFDFSSVSKDNCRFFEKGSDEYFCNNIPEDKTFDLIFLDGLHTFEQTLRDLNNALFRTHVNSLILIDDTYPADVFASIPDRESAIRHRREALPESHFHRKWQGDVYKIVPYLYHYFPALSYATYSRKKGNPQTVVWRRARGEFLTTPISLEQIHRISYFDLDNLSSVYNFRSETQICDELKAVFK